MLGRLRPPATGAVIPDADERRRGPRRPAAGAGDPVPAAGGDRLPAAETGRLPPGPRRPPRRGADLRSPALRHEIRAADDPDDRGGVEGRAVPAAGRAGVPLVPVAVR